MRSVLHRAGLICAGVAAALLAAEAMLRMFTAPTFLQRPFKDFEWLVSDPINAWKNRANFERDHVVLWGMRFPGHIRINALGFRGAEVAPTKAAGTLRIVCMGDSGTFGIWLASGTWLAPNAEIGFDNAYPEELSDLAAARGFKNVEVINAGVLGYSSSHGLRQLMTEILDLEPDILTVRYGFNDHNASWDPALRLAEPAGPVWRFFLYRIQPWKLARLGFAVGRRIALLHPDPMTVPWTSVDEFAKNLRRFVEVSRSKHVHLMFLDYPLRPLERGASAEEVAYLRAVTGVASAAEMHAVHTSYQEIVQQTARSQGVPLLATVAALQDAGDASFSPSDMVHPSREGARLIARLLFEKLLALGWLRRAR